MKIDDLNAMTPAQFDRVLAENIRRHEAEPQAVAVRYDRENDSVIIFLRTGVQLVVPRRLLEGLEDATPDELDSAEILGGGYAVQWEESGAGFTVAGLAAGLFGTRAWMARRAGQGRSEAKALSSRENGKKGGRPRKSASVGALA